MIRERRQGRIASVSRDCGSAAFRRRALIGAPMTREEEACQPVNPAGRPKGRLETRGRPPERREQRRFPAFPVVTTTTGDVRPLPPTAAWVGARSTTKVVRSGYGGFAALHVYSSRNSATLTRLPLGHCA